MSHYKGEPLRLPNTRVIHEVVRVRGQRSARGLDVGVTEDWDMVLVEVNDMISLGSYGLDPTHYAYLIETRWRGLVDFLTG
jgi:hypothetical protein